MALKFGIVLLPENLHGIGKRTKLADELGYDSVLVADSQASFHDVYVALTVASVNTKSSRIGTGVTNPVTRHPTITAGAMASINKLSGGRAILGLGTGMSAVENIGEKAASAEFTKEYLAAIRELYRIGETIYQRRTIRMTWHKERVPIWIAANGQKALRLAGEIADGVILGCGYIPERIKADISIVEDGAKSTGRSLQDIEIWLFGPANIAETREAALDPLKSSIAARAWQLAIVDLAQKRAPNKIMPLFQRLVDEYRFDQHQGGPGTPNAILIDKLGLMDYFAQRVTLAGTPQECIEQAKSVASAGVTGLALNINTPDQIKTIRDIGENVIPAFKA